MTNRQKVMITASVLVGMLLASVDQTIVDTAFPKMISELGGVSMFTWVITAYLLASTSIVPVVGKLADIYGRKLFWMLGVTIFVGGSVLCGQAHDMTQLIIFRGLQGIGGGMIMPIAMTVIGDVYSGEQRAKMMGLFTGVYALGSAIGPLLGGYIVDHFHWKYIFLLNVPTGILALLLAAWSMTNTLTAGSRRIDWTGSFLSVAGITALLLALQTGGSQWAWVSWQSISLLVGSAVCIALFIVNELRVPSPILDLRLFQNRVFSAFTTVALIQGAGMFGAVVYVPWFIQGVVGVSATNSGTVSLPLTLLMMVGSVAGGQIARRLEYRWQTAIGLLFVIAGFYQATLFNVVTSLWQARFAMMSIGLGLGLAMPLTTLGVQQAFDRSRRGVVTSAITFFRSMGATVGVTVLGIVFNRQMTAQYNSQMAPRLAQLPPALAAGLTKIAAKPTDLVQVLLQTPLQAAIPEAIRPTVLDAIKNMMANSIHPVFWVGIGLIAAAVGVAMFLGNESLSRQIKRQPQAEAEAEPEGGQVEPAWAAH